MILRVGLLSLMAVVGLFVLLWGKLSTPQRSAGEAAAVQANHEARSLVRPWAAPRAAVAQRPDPLRHGPCEMMSLVDELRRAERSAAYRRYLLGRMKAIASSVRPDQLWSLLEGERDPDVLEALAVTWVTRYNEERNVRFLRQLLGRVRDEQEPELRAALVRALRETTEPSCEILASLESAPVRYSDLAQDPSPAVRQAVADNLLAEGQRAFGRSRGVVEEQVAIAAVASDPVQTAALLEEASLEAASAHAVGIVREMLVAASDSGVRAAAATAIGGVAAPEAESALNLLIARYEAERDPDVRRAIQMAIVRIGLERSIPLLEGLRKRETEQELQAEIDTWLVLLARNPQQWSLLIRDKKRLEQGT